MVTDLGSVLFFVLLSVEFTSSTAVDNIIYRSVDLAATVGLECFVDDETLHIVWTKNRRTPLVIGPRTVGGSRISLMNDYPRERHLRIEDVRMSDAGSYECLADSRPGPIVVYNLTVLAKQKLRVQVTTTEETLEVTTDTHDNTLTTEKETSPGRTLTEVKPTSAEVKPTSAFPTGKNGVEEKFAGKEGKGGRIGYDLMVLLTVMSFGILMIF
ncbi:uncharacterized protein [Argopecten irradians]|uniref:uncharacterized protein isoform X1 n=1 Tax=Argopecten irradians TaxID=31199 RepID=UPI003719DF9B